MLGWYGVRYGGEAGTVKSTGGVDGRLGGRAKEDWRRKRMDEGQVAQVVDELVMWQEGGQA